MIEYCDMMPERRNSRAREMAVAREQLDKNIISVIAVMSWNNRRAVGSGVAMWFSARQTVRLQWNTLYHITYIN
jgi:hypothetical protein